MQVTCHLYRAALQKQPMNGDKSLQFIVIKMVMPSGFGDKKKKVFFDPANELYLLVLERGLRFFKQLSPTCLIFRVPGGMENKFSIPEGFSY